MNAQDANITPPAWSIGSCGALPTGLQDAFDKASMLAGMTGTIVHIAGRAAFPPSPADGSGSHVARLRMPPLPRAARVSDEDDVTNFLLVLESIKTQLRNPGAMGLVTNELTAVSEPGSRFGEANAHKACFRLALDAWLTIWQTADPTSFSPMSEPGAQLDPNKVRAKFREVCAEVIAREWPDFEQLRVACEVEACKVAAARLQRGERSPVLSIRK